MAGGSWSILRAMRCTWPLHSHPALANIHSHRHSYHTSAQPASEAAPGSSGPAEQGSGDASQGSSEGLKQQLLDAALGQVPQHGWTTAALQAAARQLGLSPAVTGLLPRREAQLVEHFISNCNAALRADLATRDAQGQLSGLDTKGRLRLALRTRLAMLKPHVNSWSQALSVVSHPSHLPHALPLLYAMVDDVWAAAGDKATDTSWYTKRALLAGVYTATELYMLTDYSPDFEDTWQALDRRLDDVTALGGAVQGLQGAAAQAWHRATEAAKQAAAAAASSAQAANAAAAAAAAQRPSGSGLGEAAAQAAKAAKSARAAEMQATGTPGP